MRFLSNERGFTLIEVVASIVIISMALLLLSNFIVRSYVESGVQDNQLIARNIARQIIEDWNSGQYYKKADFQTIKNGSGTIVPSINSYYLPPSDNLDFTSFITEEFFLNHRINLPITFEFRDLPINQKNYKGKVVIDKLEGNYSEKTGGTESNIQFQKSLSSQLLVHVEVSGPNSRVPVVLETSYTYEGDPSTP
jgi:prepilin-type N-terminal cleavage/methylation domain-containing protein